MADRGIGVIGATSHVGHGLLESLSRSGRRVVAFTRGPGGKSATADIRWQRLPVAAAGPESSEGKLASGAERIEDWVCLAPIVALPGYLPMLGAYGARRVVALSTTGRFTKSDSPDPAERAWVQRLVEAEEQLGAWAQARGAEWIILRPTLIYGYGRDRNICAIARFIARFGFFPLLGKAEGLRQPVHARDVAAACSQALAAPVANRAYTISGAETLTYREMVARVFEARNRRARFLVVPGAVLRAGMAGLRMVPRFRYLSTAMLDRMNENLAFDHAEAARDLGFAPSGFRLERGDLPG